MAAYGTLADANAHHAARGRTLWAAASEPLREAALVRGSDYIDQRYRRKSGICTIPVFPGTKTGGRAQEREWPRESAVDTDGNEVPSDEVPIEVEVASYEAAYRELLEPGSLSPDYVPSQVVVKEKVGPIDVTYSDPSATNDAPNRPVVVMIDEILAPILTKAYCGTRVVVV